jgi:DNA modification methylase
MSCQLVECGFDLRALIVWAKNNFAVSRGHYHWQHETMWYAVRKGQTAHWSADRSQTTLWNIDKPLKSETGHSTQKPVECMLRPIENNSKAGDAVYDPFVGSGTTITAAEMTGRRCASPSRSARPIAMWQSSAGKISPELRRKSQRIFRRGESRDPDSRQAGFLSAIRMAPQGPCEWLSGSAERWRRDLPVSCQRPARNRQELVSSVVED